MPIQADDIVIGAGDHVAQFYRDDSVLVPAVGRYLAGALGAGGAIVVVATEEHRRALEAEMEAANLGRDLAGRRVLLDAAATLSSFMVDGRVDQERFDATVGSQVRTAAAAEAAAGRPVRIYGEMVALLWTAGDVMAAVELERRWNDLSRQVQFSLLCGYPSESWPGSAGAHDQARRQVCQLHSAVLTEQARQFPVQRDAPSTARHFVVEALHSYGFECDLLDAAGLILTELATNALLHARSSFTVGVSTEHGGVVRISVHDASPVLPVPPERDLMAQSGRGLRLVTALA
ncbi:MAG: MEDS domain-containing protein, partial [Actinomycetota bacterium]|nr:MEDS domain-containing protein [Actinomycetota bacterium]